MGIRFFMNDVSAYPFALTVILLITILETAPTVLNVFVGSFVDFQKVVFISFSQAMFYGFMELSLLSVLSILYRTYLVSFQAG